jgi:hypothetical protein
MDIRKKTLAMALELVSSHNITEVVSVLKKEIQKTQAKEFDYASAYRHLLIQVCFWLVATVRVADSALPADDPQVCFAVPRDCQQRYSHAAGVSWRLECLCSCGCHRLCRRDDWQYEAWSIRAMFSHVLAVQITVLLAARFCRRLVLACRRFAQPALCAPLCGCLDSTLKPSDVPAR